MNKFARGVDRRGTNSIKWDKREEVFGREDILPLWVADSDWPTAEPIIEAIKDELNLGVPGYAFPGDELNEVIVNWTKKRYDWDIEEEWIVHTSGVVPSLHMLVKTFTVTGDGVILQSPVYHPFYEAIKNNGAQVLNNQLINDQGYYRMNYDQLKEITGTSSRARMLILCNPHNPVGRVWTAKEQEKMAQICLENNCLLVSDDIHADFIFGDNTHIPLASISKEISANSITLLSPGKTFNIAGLHTSVAIIPAKNLRERFIAVKAGLLKASNNLGLVAMKAAYQQGGEWLQQQLKYLEANLEYAVDYINQNISGILTRKPEGTYLLWLDCRELDFTDPQLLSFMVNEARVGLNAGIWFGSGGEGYMRLNTACPRSLLTDGLQRIKQAIDKL